MEAEISRWKDPLFLRMLITIIIPVILCVMIGIAVIVYYYNFREGTDLCMTDECLRSARDLRISGNFSADPCEDFHHYVCARWSREHIDRGWYPKASVFTKIMEKGLILVEKFLKQKASDEEAGAVKKARDLYKSCMDIALMDSLGTSTLFRFLEELDLPKVPNFFVKTDNFSFDWVTTDAKTNRLLYDSLIGVTIEPHPKDRTKTVVSLGSPTKKSPLLMSAFVDVPEDELVTDSRVLIEEIIDRVVVKAAGQKVSSDAIKRAADVILGMMNATASIDYTDALDKPEVLSARRFEDRLNSTIKEPQPDILEKLLSEVFNGIDVFFDMDNDMIMKSNQDEKYLISIINYMTGRSGEEQELIKWYSAVYSMIMYADSTIADKILDLSMTDRNMRIAKPRTLYCSNIVGHNMGIALTYALEDQIFQKDTKEEINEMMEYIKQSFEEQISKNKWMDAKSKAQLLENSKSVDTLIGSPPWLTSEEVLDEHYKDLEIKSNTFLENLVGSAKRVSHYNLNLFKKDERHDESTNPVDANAYHILPKNSIILPLGITQFPIFHLGLDVLNYGALGSILAHEFSHATVKTKQSLPQGTKKFYDNKTECFKEMYNKSEPFSNSLTLYEHLADSGGMDLAFKAYSKHLGDYGPEELLPGFEAYSDEQLFFISFGSIWCEHGSAEQTEMNRKLKHRPKAVRCNDALKNSEDFARVFRCSPNSTMNPPTKCPLW